MREKVLSVKDLKVYFAINDNKKFFAKKIVKAVDGISFDVYKGETLGIVGESGCGKSTTGRAIVALQTPTAGSILYHGKDITAQTKAERFSYKSQVQMIFQDTYSTLDPRFTIGSSIVEPLEIHRRGTRAEQKETALKLMHDVGLAESYYNRYPHEFSGGQRQRIGVARALALNPDLLICDEPVSALDVSIQAQILNLMEELQEKYSLTYVFVSHNLSVVKHLCDRIVVMYLGNIVEISDSKDIYKSPLHPYTIALINAIPLPDPKLKRKLVPLEGDVPSPVNPPQGCPFVTRCPHAKDICGEVKPKLADTGNGHQVACHMFDGK